MGNTDQLLKDKDSIGLRLVSNFSKNIRESGEINMSNKTWQTHNTRKAGKIFRKLETTHDQSKIAQTTKKIINNVY